MSDLLGSTLWRPNLIARFKILCGADVKVLMFEDSTWFTVSAPWDKLRDRFRKPEGEGVVETLKENPDG